MSEWTEEPIGYYSLELDREDQVLSRFDDLLKKLSNSVLPKHTTLEWDHLRLELWLDSGRIIAYPALSTATNRIDKGGCQLISPTLIAEYEQLADSDLSDEDFDKQVQQREKEYAFQLVNVCNENYPELTVRIFSAGNEGSVI